MYASNPYVSRISTKRSSGFRAILQMKESFDKYLSDNILREPGQSGFYIQLVALWA